MLQLLPCSHVHAHVTAAPHPPHPLQVVPVSMTCLSSLGALRLGLPPDLRQASVRDGAGRTLYQLLDKCQGQPPQ
jgi:hypothetical protein